MQGIKQQSSFRERADVSAERAMKADRRAGLMPAIRFHRHSQRLQMGVPPPETQIALWIMSPSELRMLRQIHDPFS